MKETGKLSALSWFLPSILASCQKVDNASDFEGKVLIVGAGAAGLYAGYLLSEKGIDFQILEASNHVGGRIERNETLADFEIDLGANGLHGDYSLASDLAHSTGTALIQEGRKSSYWQKDQFIPEFPFEFIYHFDTMAEEAIEDDLTYSAYFDEYGSEKENEFFHHFAAAKAGTSPDRVSAKWEPLLKSKKSSGGGKRIFKNSCYDFIEKLLASNLSQNISLDTEVTTIDYQEDLIKITDAHGNIHEAQKVILTVPISILQQQSIAFRPSLPSEKQSAINKIGMDACVHALLKFSDAFYPQQIVGGSTCSQYFDASYGKTGTGHVLSAICMGAQAEKLNDLSETQIIETLLNELDKMFDGTASTLFQEGYVKNWGSTPNIQGAFSFCKPGHGEQARFDLAEPVADKIFFAGEASHCNGHHGTVQGAFETAYREVLKLLSNE